MPVSSHPSIFRVRLLQLVSQKDTRAWNVLDHWLSFRRASQKFWNAGKRLGKSIKGFVICSGVVIDSTRTALLVLHCTPAWATPDLFASFLIILSYYYRDGDRFCLLCCCSTICIIAPIFDAHVVLHPIGTPTFRFIVRTYSFHWTSVLFILYWFATFLTTCSNILRQQTFDSLCFKTVSRCPYLGSFCLICSSLCKKLFAKIKELSVMEFVFYCKSIRSLEIDVCRLFQLLSVQPNLE